MTIFIVFLFESPNITVILRPLLRYFYILRKKTFTFLQITNADVAFNEGALVEINIPFNFQLLLKYLNFILFR